MAAGAEGGVFEFAGAGDDVLVEGHGLVGRHDVHVVVQQAPHADYQRLGCDVFAVRRVSLLDALTGLSGVTVPSLAPGAAPLRVHCDGNALPIAPDEVFVMQGEGMPIQSRRGGKKRGDLYVRFVVEFPKSLPRALGDQGDAVRRDELARLLGQDARGTAAARTSLFGGLFSRGFGVSFLKFERGSRGVF